MKPLPPHDDLIDFLECLTPQGRQGLCSTLGLAPRTSTSELAARARAASDGPRTFDMLLKGASPDEIALLSCWALRGTEALARARAGLPAYMSDPVPEPRRTAALRSLSARGLGLREGDGLDVLPCARPFLATHANAVTLASMLESDAERAPLPFGLALAVCLFAVERPLVRADGAFHTAALKRLEKRLGGTSLVGFELRAAPRTLGQLGVIAVRQQGNTRVLEIEAHALAAAFGQDPAILVRSLLWDADPHHVTLWTYARLRYAVAASQREGGAADADLAAIDAVRVSRPGRNADWDPWLAPDCWDTLHGLSTLVFLGLAEVRPSTLPPRFRLRSPAAHGTAPWVVQPNFEVLVPWDVPPRLVARLGLCADLETVDRVCRFRLTASSVRRGLEGLGTTQDVLQLLEEGAGAPLAQNVRATIMGWGGCERPVLPMRGELLLASPTQLAALREIAPGAREVAPGLLLLPARTLDPTLARARALGIPIAALAHSVEELDGESAPERKGKALKQVEDYLARATTQAPQPQRPSAPSPPVRLDRAPSDWSARDKAKDLLGKILGWSDDDEADEGVDSDDFEDEDAADGPLTLGPARGASQRRAPWFEPPDRAAHSRPQTDVAASHGAPAEADDVTWTSPLPGLLRNHLEQAIQAGRTLRILFRNSAGDTVDRRITPLGFERTPKGEHLEARDELHRGRCTIVLDRILALGSEPSKA